ncbi:MAG: DNA cytosine methyltransferase [Deltaproteobacteria bacterium]|jgi:DNA (cytosine-5)-methyltransferase 1|nr:DNA cytosine methyltransferase [Deltaproteobacteria bacterium]
MNFIDLFSGCGGLSLGLMEAGWTGLFAVEKSPDAFATLSCNLMGKFGLSFLWPKWLPFAHIDIGTLLERHASDLRKLQGKVDLIAGGPPCQGFSYAGRRNPNDPRNKLSEEYLKVVSLVKPRLLMLENVQGFARGFRESGKSIRRTTPQADMVADALQSLGYRTFRDIITSSEVGVPQPRKRFVMIAVAKDDVAFSFLGESSPFDLFHSRVSLFRQKKGLPRSGDITAQMAIGDLELEGKETIPCLDSDVPGFMQLAYLPPEEKNAYLALMRRGLGDEPPNSLRIARHGVRVKERFRKILTTCQGGKSLSPFDKERLGLKKFATTLMSGGQLAPTITTLPDDVIHYSEPRILTVREMARLQSFPDWFSFKGCYTTGSCHRKEKCPRYTQVGNAVPPLLSEAMGQVLLAMARGGESAGNSA